MKGINYNLESVASIMNSQKLATSLIIGKSGQKDMQKKLFKNRRRRRKGYTID